MRFTPAMLALLLMMISAPVTGAEEKPIVFNWAAQDVAGNKVTVPTSGKVSVVAFVRADQSQSKDALEALKKTLADSKETDVVVVLSGPTAQQQAKELSDAKCPWPVVADTEFESSGKMGVHVWPTTVVVRSDGRQAGHLAGLPASYAADLGAYVQFAQDKIDQKTLDERLNQHTVVGDSSTQMAQRHLQVATRLLENAETDKAAAEINAGLKLAPQDSGLLLAKAKVLIMQGSAKDALDLLKTIAPGTTPAWQVELVKGKALVALQRWDEAKTVLPEALKLNPDPAEAHYLLGVALQSSGEFEKAAEELRKAFETCASGKLALSK